ncbi:MAG: hypothetical protein AAGB05_09570 [Pseudomonadota bacterium]
MVFVPGHFGEWIQGRLGPDGPIALVTLACPSIGVRASWRSSDHPRGPDDTAASELLGEDRVAALLTRIGCETPKSRARSLLLAPSLPPGLGTGVSTASLVAIARLAGADEPAIAGLCLEEEGAVDPLMLAAPDAVLWAPRRAMTLRAMPPPPRADVVGGIFGPPEWTDPADTQFPDITDLATRWQSGGDLADCAAIASAAADRTTARRGPANDPTAALARRLGALGYARAHTGPARALLFAPGTAPPDAAGALADAGFTHVLHFQTGH